MQIKGNSSLLIGGIAFLVFVCLATYLAYSTSQRLQQRFDETLSLQVRKQALFEDQIRMLQQRFVLLRDIVTVEDPFEKDELILEHGAMATRFLRLRQELESMPLSEKERNLLEIQVAQTREGYNLQRDLIERSIEETDPSHYQEILTNIQPLLQTVFDEILRYRAEIQESTKREINLAKQRYEQGWFTILTFYIFAVLLGSSFVAWMAWRQRQHQKELHWQATHDGLTELLNRVAFEQAIDELLKQRGPDQRLALLYIDLDKFKQVNDSCGHTAGDELLIQISQRMRQVIRQTDLVARIGGDEFGVVLEGCGADEAIRIAEKILTALRELDFVWDARSFETGASIGIALLDDTIHGRAELIKLADAACYAAKEKGRDQIHLYSHADRDSSRRLHELETVNQIRDALSNDQFVLYRQRIEPMNDRAQRHYEVLLRLLDGDGNLVLPDQFLPEAERHDLVTAIDCWVVRQTLNYLCRNDDSQEIYNINLSGRTLSNAATLAEIIDEIKAANCSPSRLCFEITETATIRNLSTALDFLEQLITMGCQIALDDFGSGLSSFSYLKQLPVNYLKIDGSFIRELESGSLDYAFVQAIHSVSTAMGIRTVAEWVETAEIYQQLETMGIDYAQGYYIARPEPLHTQH